MGEFLILYLSFLFREIFSYVSTPVHVSVIPAEGEVWLCEYY